MPDFARPDLVWIVVHFALQFALGVCIWQIGAHLLALVEAEVQKFAALNEALSARIDLMQTELTTICRAQAKPRYRSRVVP